MSHSFLAEDASLRMECLSNAVCRCLSFCALLPSPPFPFPGMRRADPAGARDRSRRYTEKRSDGTCTCVSLEEEKGARAEGRRLFSPAELLLLLPGGTRLRLSHGTGVTPLSSRGSRRHCAGIASDPLQLLSLFLINCLTHAN